jgi:anaerobic ribonucleoside-triphosphate reductase activating protein
MKISTIQANHKDGGPGIRSEVFFWGCKKTCPGCQNAWISDFKPRKVKPRDVISQLLKIGNPKLSISGGEPMEQARSLAKLVKLHRATFVQSDILVFTGWTLHEVWQNKYCSEIMRNIDYIVTGPWIREMKYTIVEDTCVGSENQKAYRIIHEAPPYTLYSINPPDIYLEPLAVDSYGHLLPKKEKS